MKCYNKSILLIACMVIFLLIGAVSANKNDTISNVGMDDNTLLGSVNQSCDLSSQQNYSDNLTEHNLSSQQNYSDDLAKHNSSSRINIENEFNNSPNNNSVVFLV